MQDTTLKMWTNKQVRKEKLMIPSQDQKNVTNIVDTGCRPQKRRLAVVKGANGGEYCGLALMFLYGVEQLDMNEMQIVHTPM